MNWLLPAPKSIKKIGNEVEPDAWQWVCFPKQLEESVQEILQIIDQKYRIPSVKQSHDQREIAQGFFFYLGMNKPHENVITFKAHESLNLIKKTDAYILNIEKEGIVASSATLSGLYYALQTLKQILNGYELFELYIVDWPDLLCRGVHIDAKGERPGFEKLKNTLTEWSHYKVNTVLFEYEDAFPYSSQPDIVGADSFSQAEIQQLNKHARDHFITIVPLVQCIGHVEYILRNGRYADLRENGEIAQFCSSREEVFDLVGEMIFELAEAHPDSPWIHIGGDEAWYLGNCPNCADKVTKNGLGRLYIDHINRVIQLVKSTGKTPIIWDDVLRRLESREEIERLDRSCVIHYWDYQTCGNALDSDWIRFLQSLGFQVIGGSAMRGASGMDSYCPHFQERFKNSRNWGFTAERLALPGVISTSWGRYGTLKPLIEPFDLGWYGAIAAAEHFWNTRGMEIKEYDERLANAFLNDVSGEIPRWMKKFKSGLPYKDGWLDGRKLPAENASERFLSLIDAMWKWRSEEQLISRRIELLEARLYRVTEESFPDWERWRMMDRANELRDHLTNAAEELRHVLAELTEPRWVNEYIQAFTYKYVFRIDNLLTALTPSTPRTLEKFVRIGADYG